MIKFKTTEYLSPNSGENTTKSSAILNAIARNMGTKMSKNS